MSLPGVESARRRRVSHGRCGDYRGFLLRPPPLHRRSTPHPSTSAPLAATTSCDAAYLSVASPPSAQSLLQVCADPIAQALDERVIAARHRLDARLRAPADTCKSANTTIIRRHSSPASLAPSLQQAAARAKQQAATAMKVAMFQRRFGGAALHEAAGQTECPVCLDNFVVGQMTIDLPCNHTFHSKCIVPWLQKHDHCPSCRANIPLP